MQHNGAGHRRCDNKKAQKITRRSNGFHNKWIQRKLHCCVCSNKQQRMSLQNHTVTPPPPLAHIHTHILIHQDIHHISIKVIMLRSLLLIAAIVATANAGAVDLNPDNFDAEVTSSGKGAFVKFLAPW